MATETPGERYCAKLREKAQLLKRFSEMTAGMKNGIESKDPSQIAFHVKKRQGVICKIESIDGEINKLMQDRSFSAKNLSKRLNNAIKDALNQIRTCLETLADMDRKCLAMASAEYCSIKSDILRIRSGLRVAKGYGRTRTKNPRFLDLKR